MQSYQIQELTSEELNAVCGGADVTLSASHTENSNGSSSTTVTATVKFSL